MVRTENIIASSGKRTPQRVIVIQFLSREKLDACFTSKEYKAIMANRENSVDSRALIVEGL